MPSKDDNDRLREGTLPNDPEEGARTMALPPDVLRPVSDILKRLPDIWSRKDPAVTTGLRQFDSLLSGGLRPGNVIALGGAAKAGKSAFAGQVAYEAAKAGAIVVYASVEMPEPEVVSRWIVRETFLADSDARWPISYGDVLFGKTWRGDGINESAVAEQAKARLLEGMRRVDDVASRIFVKHLEPGSTPANLRAIVQEARESASQDTLTVLVVDPVQRLYAAASGTLGPASRALDSLNADETARVGMVAQQLKAMADDESLRLAIIFTSDTTKAAVSAAAGSETSLRGSYQLNHLATTILGLTSAEDWGDLGRRLEKRKAIDEGESKNFAANAEAVFSPTEFQRDRPDAPRLGLRVAYVDCSGSRFGRADNMFFGFVGGAMTFAECAPREDTKSRGRR